MNENKQNDTYSEDICESENMSRFVISSLKKINIRIKSDVVA